MVNIKMRALVVLLCYLFLTSNGASVASEFAMRRACGYALADLVAKICDNNYATLQDQPIGSMETFDYNSDIFISPKNARRLIRSSRTKRQGIADECCSKSCSLTEMRAYCNS
nr:bombyxin A-3 homolog isoform X2 [Onthophagus taurus]